MESPKIDHLHALLDLAIQAARAPAARIMATFRNPGLQIERKTDGTIVTAPSREAERQIRLVLQRTAQGLFPIIGRELRDRVQSTASRWVIDPLDGILSHIRGIPLFGTLVALDDKSSRPLLGAIHLPAFDETYSAARGAGAWCNGFPIRASSRDTLGGCIFSVPYPVEFESAQIPDGHARVARAAPCIRTNFDCWTHAMAARGAIDAVIELSVNRGEIAATEILIEEAGGRCVIRPSKSSPGKQDTIFGSPAATEQIARLLDFC